MAVTRAEFEAFFAHGGAWDRLLSKVEVPDMEGASWDRKACYLLMVVMDNTGSPALALRDLELSVSTTPACPYCGDRRFNVRDHHCPNGGCSSNAPSLDYDGY